MVQKCGYIEKTALPYSSPRKTNVLRAIYCCYPAEIHNEIHRYTLKLHMAGYRMGKNYLDDLQTWVAHKKGINGSSANSARVVFLAIRGDVKAAIEAGYSLTTIWEHMHDTGRVTTTYETFRRHVRRYIREPVTLSANKRAHTAALPKQETGASPSPVSKPERPQSDPAKRETTKASSQLPTFNFSPGKNKG